MKISVNELFDLKLNYYLHIDKHFSSVFVDSFRIGVNFDGGISMSSSIGFFGRFKSHCGPSTIDNSSKISMRAVVSLSNLVTASCDSFHVTVFGLVEIFFRSATGDKYIDETL